jgi:NAD(P)-dependent dehydrogenase (short-subunit alcohol dehydrogenase family)
MSIAGKVVIITGGGGIGRAAAELLARHGAKLGLIRQFHPPAMMPNLPPVAP